MVTTRRLAGLALTLWLSGAVVAHEIYSCVDGKGRKITADRPIVECSDRTQHEISPTGTVKRVIGPTLTAQERAANEETEKLAAEQRAQAQEVKWRDRALLLRYPNQAVHDKERVLALVQLGDVVKASNQRTQTLIEERKTVQTEMEFYKKNPAKAPVALNRKMEENENSLFLQKRFLADQEAEKLRIDVRFDDELTKLRQLWFLANSANSRAAPPFGLGKPTATNKN